MEKREDIMNLSPIMDKTPVLHEFDHTKIKNWTIFFFVNPIFLITFDRFWEQTSIDLDLFQG